MQINNQLQLTNTTSEKFEEHTVHKKMFMERHFKRNEKARE